MALSLYRGFVFHITLKLNNDKRNNIHCGTMNVKPELYLNLSIFFLNFIILPERILPDKEEGREREGSESESERREKGIYVLFPGEFGAIEELAAAGGFGHVEVGFLIASAVYHDFFEYCAGLKGLDDQSQHRVPVG